MPQLSPLQLEAALSRLDALGISKSAKKELRGILKASANPDGQAIDVVVRQLERERQLEVSQAARAVTKVTGTALLRAAIGLNAISDDEWDRLVEQANGS